MSITKNEAFGLALAEGMYYGKPAITFKIEGSGVNYVNLSGITGLEVDNKDIKKYAQAMIKLAKNPELRDKYGKAAKERVVKNFLNKTFIKNINHVVEKL